MVTIAITIYDLLFCKGKKLSSDRGGKVSCFSNIHVSFALKIAEKMTNLFCYLNVP